MSHPNGQLPLASGECRLIVVQDHLQPCPYLPGVTARMPLRLPVGGVSPSLTDVMLENGFRRSGDFVYTPQCPTCSECKPTRVDATKFCWTSSMRRVLNRGDRELETRWAHPTVDSWRVELFNRHRDVRSLGSRDEKVDSGSYRAFLTDSCFETRELSVRLDGQLIAVSTVDIGERSVSAVYTYFDPDFSRYSLGTYAILKQIEWCGENNRQYVYLGMYVADNAHLNYKSRFLPQERLCNGEWVSIAQA
jgi:leucyl-tRNA---protein transferase